MTMGFFRRYGPWALVTGASSGIGEEMARRLATRGLSVVLVARRRERLEALAAELERTHRVETSIVEADLGDPAIPTRIEEATRDLAIGQRGKMAIVTLDDGRARVDIVIYNEILGEQSSWLKEDQLLVAKVIIGNSMNDPNELRITAEKLYDLTNARSQSAKKIQFTINQSIIDCKLVVPKLKELIAASLPVAKGNHGQVQPTRCPVTILYQNQQATCVIELGDAWHVLLSDFFIESVPQLFKPENVEILY